MKPLKSKVSISLDDDIIRITKELADADDRTFSSYVNIVLKKHIRTRLKEQNRYGADEEIDLSKVSFLEDDKE